MRSLLLVASALAKKGWSEALRFARPPYGATTIRHVMLAFGTGRLSDSIDVNRIATRNADP